MQIPYLGLWQQRKTLKNSCRYASVPLSIIQAPYGKVQTSCPASITIAFPTSWIFILYFGYQIVRDEISVSGPLATLRDLAPLLLFALIWSVIGITNNSQCPERSKAIGCEGDVAMAIVTHQELIRGKHRRSQIRYEFRDASGRLVQVRGPTSPGGCMKTWKHLSSYNPTKPLGECDALRCYLRTKNRLAVR